MRLKKFSLQKHFLQIEESRYPKAILNYNPKGKQEGYGTVDAGEMYGTGTDRSEETEELGMFFHRPLLFWNRQK